jgi:hypothetical protein
MEEKKEDSQEIWSEKGKKEKKVVNENRRREKKKKKTRKKERKKKKKVKLQFIWEEPFLKVQCSDACGVQNLSNRRSLCYIPHEAERR